MTTTIHLDTSFMIRALVAGTLEDHAIREWLRNEIPLVMSSICWAEFLCGPLSQEEVSETRTFLQEPQPFTHNDAAKTSELFNKSGRKRGSMIDCMVAAQAICNSATLATSNPEDFKKFESHGLLLIRL